MLTGNSLLNMLVDELNEMGLPNMAAELDKLLPPDSLRWTALR